MSTKYSPSIITNGLGLALDAGNIKSYPGSGTSWYDLSGNNRTGTLTNGPTFSNTNGGNIVFDGTNDVVTATNFIGVDSNLTISTWVKVLSGAAIVDTLNDSIAWDGYGLWANGTGNTFRFILLKTYSAGAITLQSNVGWVGNWQQVVGVYNGSQALIYINGVLDNSANYSGGYDVGQGNIGIGARPSALSPSSCSIAQVHIYNRALSATEVALNYNATKGRFGT